MVQILVLGKGRHALKATFKIVFKIQDQSFEALRRSL